MNDITNDLELKMAESLKCDYGLMDKVSPLLTTGFEHLEDIIDNILYNNGFSIFKDIPIVGYLVPFVSLSKNILDEHLLKNTFGFLVGVQNGTLKKKDAKKLSKKLENPSFRTKEMNRVLLLLSKNTEYQKNFIYGSIYKEYLLNDEVTLDLLYELFEITDRLYLSDVKTLKEFYDRKEPTVIKGKYNYHIGRLLSLGLIENEIRAGGTFADVHDNTDEAFKLGILENKVTNVIRISKIGDLFMRINYKNSF